MAEGRERIVLHVREMERKTGTYILVLSPTLLPSKILEFAEELGLPAMRPHAGL